MKTVKRLPKKIQKWEHVWIPLSDGVRLAARVWMPRDAGDQPVPAILEYIPYRKRDGVRLRDETMHPYFAGHGYASVRVDLRGSGDSYGVLTDEYLQQELDDGVEVIKWIAAQPWCSGQVGMIGISWGGFNGLQIAAMQPPQLKAIVTVCSTDDRYADDVHYMGGCLLGDNLSWASTMFGYNSMPPDPRIVGEDWRDMWFQRLEGSGLWLDTWLQHQHRDEYWKHGSICEDYKRVQIPVMAVSGWADGYSNAVFRMLQNLDVPRLGLVGPWSHKYPHIGVPGPAIGFLQECVRWWDKWLKGEESGIMNEPMLRAWMLESMPPTTFYHQRYGRWVSEKAWPSPNTEWRSYDLGRYSLVDAGVQKTDITHEVQSPLSLGLFAGKWCSYSATPDLPHDQREEDGGALIFTSEALQQDIEILGPPVVELQVAVDKPVAMIAVRLLDVQPDDKSSRVTYGLLNLCHRESHAEPSPLEPGHFYSIRLQLNDIAQRFPLGHRIRLAISTSYYPLAWTPPSAVRMSINTVNSRLHLPVRPETLESIEFDQSVGTASGPVTTIEEGEHNWWVKRDLAKDVSTLEVVNDDGCFHIEEIDLTVKRRNQEWYSSQGNDFSSPKGETLWVRGLSRNGWSVETVTRTVLNCDVDNFYLHATLDAFEGEHRVFSQNWERVIKRNLV